jgi:hypothetical protein
MPCREPLEHMLSLSWMRAMLKLVDFECSFVEDGSPQPINLDF